MFAGLAKVLSCQRFRRTGAWSCAACAN